MKNNNKVVLIIGLFIFSSFNPALALLTRIKDRTPEDMAETCKIFKRSRQVQEELDKRPINLFDILSDVSNLDTFHNILKQWANGFLTSNDYQADLSIAMLQLATFTGMTDNQFRSGPLQSWLDYECDSYLSVSRTWHQDLHRSICDGSIPCPIELTNSRYPNIISLRAQGKWQASYALPDNFCILKTNRITQAIDHYLGEFFSSIHNMCVPYVRSAPGQLILTVLPQHNEIVTSCLHHLYVLLSGEHKTPPISDALIEVYKAFDPSNEQETLQRWGLNWMDKERIRFFSPKSPN